MNVIFDCARCPISVLPIFIVFFRHLLIWPEVAVHMTLSKSTYLQPEGSLRFFFRDDSRSGDAYEALLNVGESTGGLRNAWGNMAVLHGRRGW